MSVTGRPWPERGAVERETSTAVGPSLELPALCSGASQVSVDCAVVSSCL